MIRFKEFFRTLHHRKTTRFFLYITINLFLPIIGWYAHFIEIYRVKVTKLKIGLDHLGKPFEGFRVVQISDIHWGPTNKSFSYLKKCIQLINELEPDLVVITGDFLQWDMQYLTPLVQHLSQIKAKQGILASLGNHDYGVCHAHLSPMDPIDHQVIINTLDKHNIQTLHNEMSVLERDGYQLQIIGLGDLWTEYFKPEKGFLRASKQVPTILLSHTPDSICHLKDYPFDLMLSGHSHGGQISLPLIGPVSVPLKNRKLRRGLHRINNRWLYVNRGLGYTFKARFNSLPEITCIELAYGSNDEEKQ